MSNDWKDYPISRRATRTKPLFDTGDNEGWEDARDAAKFVGAKAKDGLAAVGRALGKLIPRKSSDPK